MFASNALNMSTKYVPPHLRKVEPHIQAGVNSLAQKAALAAAAFQQELQRLAEDKAASDAACAAARKLKPPPITSTAAALKAAFDAELKASEKERIERGEYTPEEEADIAHQEFEERLEIAAENYKHEMFMTGPRAKKNSPVIKCQMADEL